MSRKFRLLITSLLAFGWFIAIQPQANAVEGLTAEVYNVFGQNNAPYIPQGSSPVLTVNVPNIDFQWGSGSVLGGPSEDVIVRFTGSIRSNTTQDISFLATADDGTKLYLDGVLITNDWFDKGGGGTTSAPISFTAGVSKTIELMYYENGGGANVFLYWDQSGSMDIIPASAFTSQAAPVVNTIGAPRNLTVVDGETSTVLDWEAPNTGNIQPERYAISFTTQGQNGWGIATGNVGDANALNTTITISHSLLETLMPSGTVWSFHIRSDNDTLPLYSENSNIVTLKIGKTQAEKDAEVAAILAAQEELNRQSLANIAVSAYESQTVTTLQEVSVAEGLKLLADSATAIVLSENVKASLQSRIDIKQSAVSSAKTLLIQANLEAEIAAQLAAQLAAQQAEAARIQAETAALIAQQAAAAQAEAERIAALQAAQEAERIRAEAEAKAEAERIEAEIEAARIQAEIEAKAEAERIAAEVKAAEEKAEAEAKAEADRIEAERIAEEERAIAEAEAEAERIAAEEEAIAEAKAKAEAEALAEEERIAKEAEEKELKEALAEEEAEQEELKEILEEAKDGKELTEEQKEVVVVALLEDLKPGESLSAAEVKASGVSYKDLPAETPVEIRTDENGNALVITAEVAANVELVQDPGALLEAAFTDPGAALAALGSIGADMTKEEREEATDMVVATVVAAGAAINAAAVAAGGATGGSTGGGGSSGGSSGSNSPGSRGGRRW